MEIHAIYSLKCMHDGCGWHMADLEKAKEEGVDSLGENGPANKPPPQSLEKN